MNILKASLIAMVLTYSTGCVAYNYDHTLADGSHVRMCILKNAADTNVNGLDMALTDGTHVTIAASTQQPDPNVVSAIKSFAETLAVLGSGALKFLGIP